MTQRYRIKHCDSKPSHEFVVKPEIKVIQQDRHFEQSSQEWGQFGRLSVAAPGRSSEPRNAVDQLPSLLRALKDDKIKS
jgi:hypothetical protein